MSYYSDGEQLWNYDQMWKLLSLAGDLELPALVELAFGGEPAAEDLLADLNRLRNHVPSNHILVPVLDHAIGLLHQQLQ